MLTAGYLGGCAVFCFLACSIAGVIIIAGDWAVKRIRQRRQRANRLIPLNAAAQQRLRDGLHQVDAIDICGPWCEVKCANPLCGAADTTTFAAVTAAVIDGFEALCAREAGREC